MPKYTFKCDSCESLEQKIADISTNKITCYNCGKESIRQMPNLKGIKTTEVVDKYTNQKHTADHKEKLTERKLDYYWSVEVPKLVNSGIYELGTMLQQGWVYYDEKNNLVTRTKPPQKE
jgi:hypothetical protein